MTCREKLKIEHPEKITKKSYGGCGGCPGSYGYLDNPNYCPGKTGKNTFEDSCTKCWDREIPELEPMPENRSYISNILDHVRFIERVMVNGDKSVNIYIRPDGDLSISVYPYPEQGGEK